MKRLTADGRVERMPSGDGDWMLGADARQRLRF